MGTGCSVSLMRLLWIYVSNPQDLGENWTKWPMWVCQVHTGCSVNPGFFSPVLPTQWQLNICFWTKLNFEDEEEIHAFPSSPASWKSVQEDDDPVLRVMLSPLPLASSSHHLLSYIEIKLQLHMLIWSIIEVFRRHNTNFIKLPLSLSMELMHFSHQHLLQLQTTRK